MPEQTRTEAVEDKMKSAAYPPPYIYEGEQQVVQETEEPKEAAMEEVDMLLKNHNVLERSNMAEQSRTTGRTAYLVKYVNKGSASAARNKLEETPNEELESLLGKMRSSVGPGSGRIPLLNRVRALQRDELEQWTRGSAVELTGNILHSVLAVNRSRQDHTTATHEGQKIVLGMSSVNSESPYWNHTRTSRHCHSIMWLKKKRKVKRRTFHHHVVVLDTVDEDENKHPDVEAYEMVD